MYGYSRPMEPSLYRDAVSVMKYRKAHGLPNPDRWWRIKEGEEDIVSNARRRSLGNPLQFQVDYWRHLDRIGEEVEKLVKWRIEKILLHSEDTQDASRLYDLWHQYVGTDVSLTTGYKLEEAELRFKNRTQQLAAVLDTLPDKNSKKTVTEKLIKLKDKVALTGLQGGGIFEWMDSVLIKCLETGRWLLLDNVNLCSGAVLDRLNSLLERQGVLALGERGEAEQVIKPHPNFRLFLTVNPKHGHISRAMRNRGVEIYLDVPDVKNIHPCDLDSLLSKRGVKSSLHKDIILDIHQKVIDQEIGPEEPGLHNLLEVVFSAEQSHQQGFPLYESLEQAFIDVYVKSRHLTSYQKETLQSFLKDTLLEKKEALSHMMFTSVDCFLPEYKTLSTFYLQEDSLFGIAKLHGALLYAILKNFEHCSISANWPRPITIRDVVGERFSHDFSGHLNLDCNILELLPYLISSFYSCATHNDVETRALWLQETIKMMGHLQPRLKGHEVYEKMMVISNIVSGCILRFNQYQKDVPWDMRLVSTIVPFSESWRFENKMITLIYYQFMCKTTNDEGVDAPHKNWRIMSALEYSKASGKGQIDDWPLQTTLIKSLYNLVMTIDYVVTTALSTNDVELKDELCAQFIYDISWRFKLSNAARRKLFLANEKQPLIPLVNEDVVSLLELHYGWFRKHTYPIILKLMGKIADEARNGISLSQLVKEIDKSLNFTRTSLLPVARKFRKTLTLPQPKTCPNQCDFAKLLHSFDSKVGLWNASNNNIVEKTNYLASSKGQGARKVLLQAAITIHENKDLSSIPSVVKDIEASINSSSQCSSGIKEITTVKLWPVMELICLQLNSAMRKAFWAAEQSNDISQYVIDSTSSWYQLIDSIPPIAAAHIQTISCSSVIPTEKENVELNYFLFEHFNRSIALTSPLTWLNWDEISALAEDQIILENKALYGLHTPLYSLFLSKIFSNSSQDKDSPTFSLKAHKNTKRLFHLIKILLWRNLPGIFSSILDCSENDFICIKNNFSKLVKNFTTVVNSKIKDVSTIEGGEDLQRVFGRLKLELEEMSRGGLMLQNEQRPEKNISACIFKLYQITSEMKEEKSNVEKSMSCGLGWAYLGYLKLKLFSLLELVDPVKKKAIKMQYMSEEVSELHKLLSAEELMKITIGAPLSWPLKEEHEERIIELEKKYKGFNQSVAVRPATSLYSDIVKEVSHLVSVLVSDENFNNRINSLTDLNKVTVSKERKENILAEMRSWLLSVTHYQDKLYNQYYVSYPDIIGPILMALAQIVYGVKLVYSAVEKEMNQSVFRGNRSVDELLKMLIIFPIADLNTAIDVVESCSDVGLMNLLNKNEASQEATNYTSQDNKIRLIKICIRIIKTLSRTYAMDKVRNTLFLILEHVVLCWNQIQEEEKVKKAQEESIYVNRMKLTEEEEAAREISMLFPSSRDDDFGDLEAPVALDYVPPTPTKKIEDPMKLKSVEIEEICQLHSLIVREQAQNHWLLREPVAEDNFVALLSDRLSVFSTLIEGFHGHCENHLDQFSIGSYLLAADLQTSDIFKPTKDERHYDFYRDTNISESKLCIPLLNAIQKRVDELLLEWPDHPTLQQITTIIQRVTGFSMSSPLSRFLTGLELLLTKLHHWEENAHAGVSLAQHSASLTNQIIAWRKLELSAWKGALHSAYLKCEERARKWWFYLFSIVTAYIRNTETASLAEETDNVVKTLQGYMETSSLGEFSVRLDLLYTFHCHALLFPSSQRQITISSILWNLYNFYKLFKNSISKTIEDLSAPIEKKLKDFVKIARWNDINYWSIKSAVEKTHHTLLKHIKEYEKILNEPARGAMFKIDVPLSNRKLNLSSLNPTYFLTSLKMTDTYKDLEGNENLLARLSSLLKKSNNICKQTITKCEYSKLIDNFELFVEEIEETGKLIQEFDIDTTIEKEKKKSIVKSLLQRKRKTVSDLFRTLTQIGLSYRSGLLMFEQNNTAFASLPPINIEATLQQIDRRKSDKDWLNCWKGSEQYFYCSVARLAMLKIALEKPHKDLGPQFIERIKGFTSHSNSLLHLLKETLGHCSENIYVVRCQIAQLLKLQENNYGLVSDSFGKNKLLLKSLLNDVIYCLRQFVVLLDACPEEESQLTDIDEVPTIFPLPLVESMLSAFKYDTIWESTKVKVQSILKSCLRMQDDISILEKHNKLASSFNKNSPLNADILINQSEFMLVEDCFSKLGDIVVEITKVQQLFNQSVEGQVIKNPLISCLDTVILNINNTISDGNAIEFPSNKSITINEILENIPKNCIEKLEAFINKVLCIIQNFYKKHVPKNEEAQEATPKTDENLEGTQVTEPKAEVDADLIVDGHLKEKLVHSLISDSKILRISEISDDLADVFSTLTQLEHEIEKESLQGLLFYMAPLLDQLVSIYHYFNVQLTGAFNILGKFSSSLLLAFTEFSRNGYNVPDELREEEEGEGETKKGGLGLGEGEGEKDVSDQIESEDQLEDARKPGEYGQDEDKDCKEEEKGIDMSEDFGGKLQDIEKKDEEENDDDKEDGDEEEPDKEMGETEKGADTLDKQVWGSDSEEEPEDDEELPKDEKGNKGAEQNEKQLGAGEEEKEAVDDKEEKQSKKKEPKEKEINEMDEPEIDDDQIDPYHGKQQPSPEVEPLEIPDDEDMAVDEDDKGSEGEDEKENPFDIDVMKKKLEEENPPEEDKPEDKDKTEEDKNEEDKPDDDELPNPELKKPEVEEAEEEEESSKQDETEGKVEKEKEEEKVGAEEASGTDEKSTDQQAEQSASKEGSKDQVKNSEDMDVNVDNDPEESQAEGREETGAGRAEKEDKNSGGHRGTAGKRKNAGESEVEERKQKPGQSEIERSLGSVDEPVKKKLKTIGIQKENEVEKEKMDTEEDRIEDNSEADLYQHIHEANKSQHDAQTVDAATQEQAEKQMPVIGDKEDEKPEGEEEIIEISEDDEPIDVETIDEVESTPLKDKENYDDKRKKEKGEGGGILDEATIEVEGEYSETFTVPRGYQSTFHTQISELERQMLSEADKQMLRQELEKQLASWNTRPVVQEATEAWEKICALTSSLAQQLSEELRLVLEPTTASSLKGDFRTGKRINMRKVIPYIASQFRKDKIWLRRTKPSKREYQIILAIDDSSSMADNHSKELAFESLAVVSKALNLLEAGDLAVISFGEAVKVLHQLGETFTESSGARLMQEFSFDQKKTRVAAAVETALGLVSQRGPDSAQLLVIISDGRGVMSEGESVVRSAVRKANHTRLFIVFIIIDNPQTKDSILDIRLPVFKGPKVVEIKPYMDAFPFPFYLILRDINNLPSVLSDALRQWFELVTDMQ
nr:midasin [Halyomorpha halys]